ncbi:MAG: hypothetical protein WBD46_08400 [Acidobacteriaceae bacterium]
MPPSVNDEIVFPLPPAHRRLSRRTRLILELSVGLALLAFIGIGASVRMPVWLRLIGWAFLIGSLVAQSVLVARHWKRRRGWRK